MTFRLRPLTGALLLLATSALSCGHTRSAAPPLSAASTEPAATVPQQTHPTEALHPELETADEEGKTSLPLAAAEAPPPGADSIESFMAEHFMITTWVRDSIIGGNLAPIRSPLLALAEYNYATLHRAAGCKASRSCKRRRA